MSDVIILNRKALKSLTRIVQSCLSEMGDNSLVFQMLEKVILEQMASWLNNLISHVFYMDVFLIFIIWDTFPVFSIWNLQLIVFFFLIMVLFMLQSQIPPLDNVCAMLRMLITLDSKATIISQQAFISLGNILPWYLIDIVHVSFFSFLATISCL